MIVQHMALACGHSTQSGLLIYGMNMRRNTTESDLKTWTEGLKHGIDLLFNLPANDDRIVMAQGLAEGQIQGQLIDTSFAQQEYYQNRESNWYHPLNQMVMTLFESRRIVL